MAFLETLKKLLTPPSVTYYDDSHLRSLAKNLDKAVPILNVGSGRRRIFCSEIDVDISLSPNVDMVADAAKLPFKDGAFYLVIYKAVLEHAWNLEGILKEARRVLKKGGYVYSEVPFLQPYHPAPEDYRRLTLKGIEKIHKDFVKIESGICVGPTSALLSFIREYIPLFFNIKYIRGLIYLMISWFTFWLKYLDRFLIRNKHCQTIASSFYYIGRKS